VGLTGEDWRRIAEGQERLTAASSLQELIGLVHESCSSLADYDVSCVTIRAESVTPDQVGPSAILCRSGAMSDRDMRSYNGYYNRKLTREICTDDRDAPSAVLVECSRAHQEFIDDYIVLMGIRRYYGNLLSLGTGKGFLSLGFNCASGSARALLPARERLTAIKPFVERLLALHGRLDALTSGGLGAAAALDKRLSPREAEVADLLCRRLTAKEIAAKLGISHRTVESHAIHLYSKLGIFGRAELISLFHG
jgi:DNA-binding CsgD family transcriptional regulator